MKRSHFWTWTLCLCAGIGAATFFAYDFGLRGTDMALFGLAATSVIVAVAELWAPATHAIADAFERFARSYGFKLMRLHYANLVNTMRRVFGGERQRHYAAPGHAWRHCAST